MSQRLALFDLDNTLLAGDSDHAWGEFLIARGLVDEPTHRAGNDEFYQQYLAGCLDIHACVSFALQPILGFDATQRQQLQQQFMQQMIAPMILDTGRQLIRRHQQAGDHCLIITATNAFVTAPIAREFGVGTLLATELRTADDKLTGEILGTPCYQQGKVKRLRQWLTSNGDKYRLSDACFYTDSINDLPLLETVGTPIAVDPDTQLAEVAVRKQWQIISLRA